MEGFVVEAEVFGTESRGAIGGIVELSISFGEDEVGLAK